MFLEPDEKYGHQVLEVVRSVKSRIESSEKINTAPSTNNNIDTNLYSVLNPCEKDTVYLHLMDLWMRKRENKKNVAHWLREKGFSEVTIYGYGLFGKHLLYELRNDDFEVKYIIDGAKTENEVGYKTYGKDDILPEAGALINTVILEHEQIVRNFWDRFNGNIISIRQIIEEI